ncbi:LOB domain-containing protein 40-like [Rhodamnia argentea]|uniref:LOB domain-containing protein 40-like n=1 Tax=Rhodamnia argentea TaxID=178133 RepID=A0ABM3HJC9_9MYRT|nr:LOB domain-containing protein 40-like [Rhodamnia argentea]
MGSDVFSSISELLIGGPPLLLLLLLLLHLILSLCNLGRRIRMSCNGCRVLRKGCTEDCTIRPCLQWIQSPVSQANATMFLAKFYGRAGLINLINAGPDHLRPAIFRSLLYEACGRVVNPIYGSVGLLCSGNWAQCQSSVEAVLQGSSQFMQSPSLDSTGPHLKPCDIRHVRKMSGPGDPQKIRTRTRFKQSSNQAKPETDPGELFGHAGRSKWIYPGPIYEETSLDSWVTHGAAAAVANWDSAEAESIFSVETVEASLANMGKPNWMLRFDRPAEESPESQLQLELSLRIKPSSHPSEPALI